MKTKIYSIALLVLLGAVSITAQAGGTYDLSHHVVSGGGEMQSAGGSFKLDGTASVRRLPERPAQAVNTACTAVSGFDRRSRRPARATVAGRVNNTRGGIVRRVRVILTDTSTGAVKSAQTNSFGYFRFEDVEIGHIYIVRAESKNFTFTPEMHVFTLFDERGDLDFTAVGIEP